MSTIQTATINDLPAIVTIYNQAVKRGFCTADTEPVSIAQQKDWFRNHSAEKYPVYVCKIEENVVGWLSITPYRKGRKALRYAAEVSYYVDESHQKQGIGSALMKHAIDQMPQLELKTLIAILLEVNEGSIRLLEKFGFRKWGHLPDIADFNGKQCGQFYYGYQISDR
ncbi:MAG: N-acetyltransferase family protein [Fidelibacterota bacterium]